MLLYLASETFPSVYHKPFVSPSKCEFILCKDINDFVIRHRPDLSEVFYVPTYLSFSCLFH